MHHKPIPVDANATAAVAEFKARFGGQGRDLGPTRNAAARPQECDHEL